MSLDEDIVDIITDILQSESDQSTLRNLCLVSRIFRSSTQRKIFSELTLCNRNQEDQEARSTRLSSLRSSLITNPILITYIRTIHISQRPLEDGTNGDNLWLDDPALVLLLEELIPTSLQRLRLHSELQAHYIVWEKLNPLLQDVLRRLISKPSLQVLSLKRCVFPPGFFAQLELSCLEQMEWVQTRIDLKNSLVIPDQLAQDNSHPCLSTLRLTYGADPSPDPKGDLSAIQHSGLGLISLKYLYVTFDGRKPFLPQVPQFEQIQELHVELIDKFETDFGQSSWQIDPGRYQALRRLSLHHIFPNDLDTFIAWIANTLQNIPSSHPTLSSIIIGLNFEPASGLFWDRIKPLSLQLLRLTQESNGVLKPSSVVVYVHTRGDDKDDVDLRKLTDFLISDWEEAVERMVIDVSSSAAAAPWHSIIGKV
ncbi:hypothetical protein BDN72DRAFT_962933 [Pluteus cervinus]|uniref:Uncharacterized protein n=1 Tax=Pluteus cervinus TaxID=181527 RepID=A0ACD3AH70_9AGAR|nr:hypothetical protein BDN72DRAFT_962933 [Pluteus cervinus]